MDFSRYLDSELMEFDGDIIITDPCYITKNDDWSKCDYGEHMEALGLHNYICRDTMYGDWSCTTFNSDTDEKLGEFCADAGMVAVFDLAEVLAYNPEFDYHTDRSWTTTWMGKHCYYCWMQEEFVRRQVPLVGAMNQSQVVF